MRTVTYKSVLHGVARLLGMDPARDLNSARAATLTAYINPRLSEAWRFDFWPEWTLCQERQYRPDYDAAANVVTGDERLWTDGVYYRALQDQAPAAEDPSNAAYWEVAADLDKYVAYEQGTTFGESGSTAIDEVKRCSKRNPRLHPRNPGEVRFWVSEKGVQFGPEAPAKVWIEFRKRPPVFTSEVWSTDQNYAAGDLVYLPANGECYQALIPTAGENPAATPGSWEVAQFPAALAGYVIKAAMSDGLRDQKQTDRALAELAQAKDELQDAVDRALDGQGQYERARVESY